MAKPMALESKNLPFGKAISGKISLAFVPGARLFCADNSGAQEIEIITVKKRRTMLRQMYEGGIGDLVVASVKKGKPEIRKQVVFAVVIRQKKPYRRHDGTRVCFEDNAAVLVTEEGSPRGTEIKGPVPREVIERWAKIAPNASTVV